MLAYLTVDPLDKQHHCLWLGGVRSCCTYVGASKLKELSRRTTFIRVRYVLAQLFFLVLILARVSRSFISQQLNEVFSSNTVQG